MFLKKTNSKESCAITRGSLELAMFWLWVCDFSGVVAVTVSAQLMFNLRMRYRAIESILSHFLDWLEFRIQK